MAVIIKNLGAVNGEETLYQLRINEKQIAQFTHKRNHGLGACLRAAADAADREVKRQLIEFAIKRDNEK